MSAAASIRSCSAMQAQHAAIVRYSTHIQRLGPEGGVQLIQNSPSDDGVKAVSKEFRWISLRVGQRPLNLLKVLQGITSKSMNDSWTNRLTIPVERVKEFAELSACYQEALKDRGAIDCTYKLWSEMSTAEKTKARKSLPSTANNWYVN